MPTFKYDGKTVPFQDGESIIGAARKQGLEIPHYCWHPGLSAPANCRMCLVEILPKPGQRAMQLDVLQWDAAKGDYVSVKKPKLLPACQMPAADGMEVLGDSSPHVAAARKGVQEFLLLNHPVDCPICDQAGECKLQDYWMDYGQFKKRMNDEVVHKPKAVSFGDTIVYDAERCVMCSRCVRFMEEVAADPVLDMRERGNLKEVFVADGRKLEGHYTLMTEHVCPVGALTSKDFRFKARVWFLKTAKTVCQGCATGCNADLDFDPRTNKAYRYRPRENDLVNKFWMCDEGMLSYRRAHDGRITEALVDGQKVTVGEAVAEAAHLLDSVPRTAIGIVLSAEHSLEDNWALAELAKLLGTKSIYSAGAAPGYADAILIHKDKNSNSAGLKLLAPNAASFPSLVEDAKAGRVTHVISLGAETPVEAALGGVRRIAIAAHDGPLTRGARVVLPATSFAEQHGTYVNAKGIRQLAEKGLEPQGASKPGWQFVSDLARALAIEPSWTKLKQIRSQLVGVGGDGVAESADQNTGAAAAVSG